jgi:hypothetical protein
MKQSIANYSKKHETKGYQDPVDLFLVAEITLFIDIQRTSHPPFLHAIQERFYEGETFISNPKPLTNCLEACKGS